MIGAAVYAQRNDNAEYWHTFEYKAKEGMVDKFMEAAAEKTQRFNSNPDHAMVTYRIITGRNAGTFVRVQANKKPADYDIDRTAELNYWNENVSKYIGENLGQRRWQRLSNGSYNFDPDNSVPKKFVQRTFYDVKPDKVVYFRRFMERVAKTLEKRNWDGSRLLFRLVSGGNRNLFVVSVPFDTYKQNTQPENDNTFEEDYNELFGWDSFDDDYENFEAGLEGWGEYVDTLQLVPEMSTKME